MNDNSIDVFLNNGQIISSDGTTPFFLNNPYVWIVLEGSVDVFYIKNHEDSTGALHYLFSVNKGDALIGYKEAEKDKGNSDIELVAKTLLGTKLIKIARSEFLESAQSINGSGELDRLIKGWITKFKGNGFFKTNNYLISESGDLGEFYPHIFKVIGNQHNNKGVNKENPLYKKMDYNDVLFNEAFSSLAAVVERKSVEDTCNYLFEPLFDALKYIEEASSIKFSYPAALNNIKDIQNLKNIAEKSGLRFRRVSLTDKWWKVDNGPLLGFLRDETPVALLPASHGSYILKNPVTKETHKITYKTAENLAHFAYYFYRSLPNNRKIRITDLFKFSFTPDNLKDLKYIFFLGLFGGILGMVTPYFAGILFDTVIPASEKFQLVQIAIALFMISFSMSIFQFARSLSFLRIGGKIDASLQSAVIDRLINLPVSFFKRFTAGDLADRANSINLIMQSFTSIIFDSIISAIFSSLNILLLFYYSWKLALFAIVATAIYLVLTFIGNYFIFHHQRILLKINGKLTGFVLELINGISKLRVAGAEKRAFFLWSRDFSKLRKESYKIGKISNYISVLSSIHPVIVMTAIFGVVVFSVHTSFTTGNFIAFSAAFAVFQSSVINMFRRITSILNIIPLYERMLPILNTSTEIEPGKPLQEKLKGDIEINHVSFKYSEDAPFVLNDISLQIKPGQFIAIVGPSGSGKSTLLRILLGFEKPIKGSIFYDNHDLCTLNIQSIRKQIGVVLQNGELMPDNIFNNIIGTSNCSLEDAWEAVRIACIDKDISEMPMKMFTIINEGASTISVGQKQRLLIARALVHKPGILFFDEATSSLDNNVQSLIIENLEKMNATRIVIAHRLSTIINADLIYVMDKGKIVQSGTFNELLSQDGVFTNIAKRQMVNV